MPSIIKIKRSGTAAGAPASLKSGELSYTYTNGVNKLYFGKGDDGSGNATSIVQIGGEFYTDLLSVTAGTLTASKSLIVDANSKLDNLKVDNIDLNGNTFSSTDTNGNLLFVPNGTGQVSFYNAYTFPTTLGAAGQALVSNGSGGLIFGNVNVATTASNIAGGTAGQVPYQTGAGVTSFYGPGTAGQILVSGGTSAPTYTNTSSIYVGRAFNADKWLNTRTITLGGDLGGSAIFDGSENFTLTATIQANSVTLGTDTTGNYVATGATSGFGLSGSTNTENATFTVSSNATSTNANSTIVFRDASGNFSAGTITAATAFSGTLGTGGSQSINSNAVSLSAYADNTGILYFSNGTGLIASNANSFAWNNSAGTLNVKTNTAATSTTTGALVVAGGVGIGGNLYVGGEIFAERLTIQYTTVTTALIQTDDVIRTSNNTNATSTLTGALVIAGGGGFGRDVWVGGSLNVASGITGLITSATNISGGTAGQVPYQTGAGVTSFYGPGIAGQILVSGGTSAPTYTNTGSIYVGRAFNADKWLNTRTITLGGDLGGSAIFDGSENFTLTATIQANSVALGTDTTGNYVATGATSGFGLSGSTNAENATFTVSSNATSTNANSTIVFRDASGNFSANVITADLVGTANNANDLTGGAAGSLPYQSGAGVTVFLPLGLDGKVLQVNTATNSPFWGDIDGGTY